MQGKVSMVVPCYNKRDFIGAMLESVYNQVWDSIELILVNDGSTDGTREIIEQWEPLLKSRGYDVIIVDQENAGCCAAVYVGLLHMTGDYFCLVDCDDEIYPEYTSRMAGWLDAHGDYEWAACSYSLVEESNSGLVVNSAPKLPSCWDDPMLLENLIMWRLNTMSWMCMMRVSYVKRSGMIEVFCTERHSTYEPCVNIPPAALRGKLKFFNEPLYKYNFYAAGLSKITLFDDAVKYYKEQLYLINWVIERLDLLEDVKQRYILLARLMYNCRMLEYKHLPGSSDRIQGFAENAAKLIRECLTSAPRIDAGTILSMGYSRISTAIALNVLGIENKYLNHPISVRRVIGYGALGRHGQKALQELLTTPLLPTVIWDEAACDGDSLYNIPARKPDFGSLCSDDIVIVFPKSAAVLCEIRDILGQSSAGDVLYYEQVEEFMALYTFYNSGG